MPKRAVGYVRVSTDEQAREGVSLDAQQERIRAMAVVQGAELVEIIVDTVTAKNLKRPGAQRLLEMVKGKQVDAVIIYKLDRLTRSVRDLSDLLELFDRSGVALVSVSESLDTASASGRLVLNIMASVSQWEREVISERTREGMRYLKSQGKRVGSLPYGFRAGEGNKLEPDPGENLVLVEITKMRAKGCRYVSIAGEFNKRGYLTRSGGPWSAQRVHHVIKTSIKSISR